MWKDVDQYVQNCHTCQQSKATHGKTHGLLRPLEVPERPWNDLSTDFMVGLPESDCFNAIWVVVDRLSKMQHLVPCMDKVDGSKLGEMFVKEVFRLHRIPDTIVSDRGPQFASEFWKHICKRLGVERRLSTAFHPQTNCQTERMNSVMEQYLRAFVNYQQDEWVRWLPPAEFAANNHTSEMTNCSAFFCNYGFNP